MDSASGLRTPSPDRPCGVRGALLRAVLLLLLVSGMGGYARAQTATVSGFVTDASTGQPLELANVALQNEQGLLEGAVTDRDGLYLLPRLAPGRYALAASFIGYEPFRDTLTLDPGEVRTVNIALSPDEEALGEVVVETERTSGAARVTAGQQTIRPEDIELVPTPDVSGDLVSTINTLPGVVSTGDRGGQLFIRGGEPSQNLVLLDGMLVYQPFHLLGFYSAFPSDILSGADVYAGGYGSRFGERLSSVIDVRTREGNKRRFAGSLSLSPFAGAALLEGPILPRRVSFLASARRSLVDEAAARYVGRPLPFTFGDAFAKIHAEVGQRARLSASGLVTQDRGTLHEGGGLTPPEEVRWGNEVVGFRYLVLPRLLPVAADLRLSHSRLESELGPEGAPTRSTSVASTQLALDASFFGDRTDAEAGWAVRFISTEANLGGLLQDTEIREARITHLSFYVEPEFTLGSLRVRPGARLEFYDVRVDPLLEPRLRLIWARRAHQVSAAAGLYHQEVIGLTDQRDAASVFTAWTNVPASGLGEAAGGKIPRAAHALLGYRITPGRGLEFSVEGFYKHLDHLFVPEWTPYPRMTTRLQPAEGRSVGFDARVELRRVPFYGFVTYGLSSTRYRARQAQLPLWFGEEALSYRPPHDRRHQVNALLSVERYGFAFSARWAFGSGLPFSRPAGFDGFVIVDDVDIGPEALRWRRAIYGRPFNAVLPTYHRLDVSLERTFPLGAAVLTAQASVINVYDRRNLFYADVFTLRRVDQLPLVPSLGLKVAFE